MKEKLLKAKSKAVKVKIESADCEVWIQPLTKGDFEKAVRDEDGDSFAVLQGVVDDNRKPLLSKKDLAGMDSLVFSELARKVAEVCTKKAQGPASSGS